MKTKSLLFLSLFIFLSSCIVKSLHPFYTKETTFFEKRLKGNWEDEKKGIWKIENFKEYVIKENDNDSLSLSEKDKKDIIKYKEAYIIDYKDEEGENVLFFVMPFKIKGQLFIDFYPIEFDFENLNNLLSAHLLKTHSLAKVDIITNDKISLSWLSQSKIAELIEKGEIKIKHEKIGVDEDLIITATSEELNKFLIDYLESDIDNKWEQNSNKKWKTKVSFNLKRIDSIP